jgi:hypothetical protein
MSVDMRVGVVIDAKEFPEARRPAYRLWIDFGPLGVKRTPPARSFSCNRSARWRRAPRSADFAYNRPVMIHRLRGRSWVGIIGSLTLHVLFVTGVWIFVGMSTSDDAPEIGARMVRLVPGERESSPARPKSSRVVGRATTPRSVAKPPASRPVTPTPEVPPPPAPAESVTPEPVVPEPEPSPAPLATTAPDPVAGSPLATLPADPVAESSATAPTPSPMVADVSVEPGPEEGRAAALDVFLRPDLAWLQELTSEATLAARAETEPFVGRRAVFEFLLDNIEFTTHVTRALRLARYRAWRTAEGLMVDDGWGALMRVSLVQATSGARVIYARAQYQQWLLPDIYGDAVVMIEYDMKPTDDGRDLVSAAVTSYVKVDSGVVAALVKLAGAAAADKAALESRRLVRNFARVSRAIEENPAKVFDEVRRGPGVPQAELEAFRRLLGIQ